MSCGCQNTPIDDFCPDAPDETVDAVAEVTTSQPLHRRTLLKVAAAGATVAAFAGRGDASPFSAMAHTDTKSSCTANDIAVSNGEIINEPCSCSGGTFDAIVRFTVSNQNNARRKCITLHIGAGTIFGARDFLLTTNPSGVPGGNDSNIAGLGTSQFMYAKVSGVPCDFTSACYPGSVIAFQTAQNNSDTACSGPLTKYPGGQCRRQDICITGFGATLTCGGGCTLPCGGTLSLTATATGASGTGTPGTYTFKLYDPNGVLLETRSGVASPQTFTVTNPISGQYKVEAYDSTGSCFRTAFSEAVTVTAVGAATLSAGTADCDGDVTYTVSNCDSSLTYTYKEVNCTTGAQIGSNLGGGVGVCELTHRFPRDGANHCVEVAVANAAGTCTAGSNKVTTLVRTPVTFRLRRTTGCSGVVTLIAEAEGGTGTFTYSFFVGTSTTPAQTGSSNEMVVQPQLDGNCRSFRVAVVDSAGCAGTATEDGGTPNPARNTVTFSQCVTTTAC